MHWTDRLYIKNAKVSSVDLRRLVSESKQLAELKENESITPFVNEFVKSVGMLLAYTPFSEWPQMCKTAFEYASKSAPTAARIYKSKLPSK